MDQVINARLFWDIVTESLIHLYGFEQELAVARVEAIRGPMTPRSIARNLVYHSQPLHVAANMAHSTEEMGEALLASYDQIVGRLRKAAEAEPERTSLQMRKPARVGRSGREGALAAR